LKYLSTPFKITEGVADFNQYDSFLPTIRVLAEARTLETKIHLQATGPLAQMEISLTSEPPLSQQQIIKLLTLREKQSTGNAGGGSGGTGTDGDASNKDDLAVLLHEGLQFTFVQRVEKVLEDFLGVDEVHVVRGENAEVTDKEVYNLEVGKFVNEKLYLGYTMGNDRTFRFRYDITNHLAFDGETDDQENRRFGLEARYSF
jgi:translocation and assembly module TamB